MTFLCSWTVIPSLIWYAPLLIQTSSALIATAAHDHNHADLTSLDYASSGHSDFAGTGVVNTFNAAQMIDGLNNEVQLRVQAADAQTEYIQTWEDADASIEAAISVTGHIGLGGLPMTNSALAIAETFASPQCHRGLLWCLYSPLFQCHHRPDHQPPVCAILFGAVPCIQHIQLLHDHRYPGSGET